MWHCLSCIVADATLFDWALLSAGILIALYIAGTWNYDFFAKRGIPALQPTLPFLGNTLEVFFGKDNFPDFLIKTVRRAKGHSMVGVFELQRPVFVIRSPQLLKIITVKEFDNFMNHRGFISEDVDPLFGKNLFNLKDERWRSMRATLSPAFSSSRIKGMWTLVSDCAQQMVQHLRRQCAADEGNEGLETDMKDLFTRMANDVIASVAFGLQCDSLKQRKNEFYENGKILTTFTLVRQIVFVVYLIFPKIIEALKMPLLSPKATRFFDSLVHETIKKRKEMGIFRPDMLQLMMQAREGKLRSAEEDRHEAEDVGKAPHKELTDEDVTAQAIIFFFAGFETVSTALCFTSYQISHNPEVQRRLQQEVDQVWESSGGKPSYEDVQGMKYLDAVISEGLRMHPPIIGVDRVCQRDTTLPPAEATPAVAVRAGHLLSVPIIGIHYDPEFWPSPHRFDPDRFSDDNKHNIRPFTYMPFGLGPRICIGQRFAAVEVKLALAHLVRHFNLVPSSKTKFPMEYTHTFNMGIKGGFWTHLSPRINT